MDELKTLLQQSENLSGLGSDGSEMTQQEREQLKADFYNASEGDMHESDGYDCRICKNKGYISVVVQNAMYGYFCEQLTPCKCWKVRSAINKLARSGLKNAVRAYTFDKYETPDAWQKHIKDTALRFCQDQQNHWFYIGGQSGAGKTHSDRQCRTSGSALAVRVEQERPTFARRLQYTTSGKAWKLAICSGVMKSSALRLLSTTRPNIQRSCRSLKRFPCFT